MLAFIAQRVVKAVVVLLAIVVLNFCLIRMAPGDPALVMAGEAGAGDQIFLAQLREKFGLDQPLPVQLYLVSQGDPQRSISAFRFASRCRSSKLILDRLPATLLLTGTAFVISLALRRAVRIAGGALARHLGRHGHHRAGADLLRHAAVLGRADGDPVVLGHDGPPAELWLPDGRRQLHRSCACAGCRRPTWCCRRRRSACSSWPPMRA